MNIIEKTYKLNGNLAIRTKTERIILHHADASSCTAEDIDRWHKNNGWTCIGYHFFVRKDGSIYRGRQENVKGAHAGDSNTNSIGICFEGRYATEQMPDIQVEAGKELVAYLKNKYNISKVQKHSDVCNTSCPGRNFRFDEIANVQVSDVVEEKKVEQYNYKDFVRDIQKVIGAKVDKIAGPETLSKTITVSKSKNNRHAIVKPIQKYLNSLGYIEVGSIDGIAGSKFDLAVKHFQKDNGCVVDGEITAKNKTWKKLLKLA